MKRINWENTVKKWEKIERCLNDCNIYSAVAALGMECGYCKEFIGTDGKNECKYCPLAIKRLCYNVALTDTRAYWICVRLINDIYSGDTPNTYGNRHKALGYCREVLQGIYADMHDLED